MGYSQDEYEERVYREKIIEKRRGTLEIMESIAHIHGEIIVFLAAKDYDGVRGALDRMRDRIDLLWRKMMSEPRKKDLEG